MSSFGGFFVCRRSIGRLFAMIVLPLLGLSILFIHQKNLLKAVITWMELDQRSKLVYTASTHLTYGNLREKVGDLAIIYSRPLMWSLMKICNIASWLMGDLLTLLVLDLIILILIWLQFCYQKLSGRPLVLEPPRFHERLLARTKLFHAIVGEKFPQVCSLLINLCRTSFTMDQPDRVAQVLHFTLVTLCMACIWEQVKSTWVWTLIGLQLCISEQRLQRILSWRRSSITLGGLVERPLSGLLVVMMYIFCRMVGIILSIAKTYRTLSEMLWSMNQRILIRTRMKVLLHTTEQIATL
uniref:Uncharacterized protein n=1 Tax=Riboviria sp. TaxID=2585031 RepID=A0A8K1WNY7_9VIRU|nr:MAG: hypothetical protein 2 [Riboviria sp.]